MQGRTSDGTCGTRTMSSLKRCGQEKSWQLSVVFPYNQSSWEENVKVASYLSGGLVTTLHGMCMFMIRTAGSWAGFGSTTWLRWTSGNHPKMCYV